MVGKQCRFFHHWQSVLGLKSITTRWTRTKSLLQTLPLLRYALLAIAIALFCVIISPVSATSPATDTELRSIVVNWKAGGDGGAGEAGGEKVSSKRRNLVSKVKSNTLNCNNCGCMNQRSTTLGSANAAPGVSREKR